LIARRPTGGMYRVEVSGWDSSQTFFVEKTELEWSEESGKQITLNRALRDNAMVFVRLLQATATDLAFPVPYKAKHIGNLAEGQWRFRLQQILPCTHPN